MKRIAVLAVGLALLSALALSGASAQESVDVAIDAFGDSGVTGSATVEQGADGNAEVTINVHGLEADTSHVNHIHDGTGCEPGEYSSVVMDLTNIDADAMGDGTATTATDLAYEDVANGAHVIVIHAGATLEEDPTPIACGAIPVASMAAPPPDDGNTADKAPVTGTGGFLDQSDGGLGLLALLAIGLAVLGLGSLTTGYAVRRIRR